MNSTEAPEEEWRPVRGFEGLYEVSSQARIKRVERESKFTQSGRDVTRSISEKILTPVDKLGYDSIILHREGKHHPKQVHRLVAEAFIPNPENMPLVLHWDDDRKNNSISNLRWGNKSDNALDAVRNGKHPLARKTHCIRGHEFSEENTRVTPGRRSCKTCETVRYEKGLSEGDPRHGTATGYSNWRCRCRRCTDAMHPIWERERRLKRRKNETTVVRF